MPILEIACFHIAAAIAAAAAGADRIELCADPAAGGTTPSLGAIRTALEQLPVPVFPIIRPRGGDFLYDAAEFRTMLCDVQTCRDAGCKGVVLGILQQDGQVDISRTRQLVAAAGPMEVTFHRAFDQAADPVQALEDVIAAGCRRLLTSGQQADAASGKNLIRALVAQAGNRLVVMPGGGIRSNTLAAIRSVTGAAEIHSGARAEVVSSMRFLPAGFRDATSYPGVDSEDIRQMKALLHS